MQHEAEIAFHGMESSPAVEQRIRQRIAKLEEFHARITSCNVVVEAISRHGHKGTIYRININVEAPQGNIVVNREPGRDHSHEDIFVAVTDAFSTAQRQLQEFVRKMRGR